MAPRIVRGYVTLGHGQIHYRAIQASEPAVPSVLLLHQVSSSSRMFDAIMPLLLRHGLRPIAPDLPGFGASDPLTRSSVAAWARVMIAFGDRVAIRWPIWIVGHHTGAAVAIEMALAAPKLVSGVILVGVPARASEEARRKRWKEKRIRRIVPSDDGRHLLHEWHRLKDLSPSSKVSLLHREAVDTFLSYRYDLAYRANFRWQSQGRLALLKCPTLVVAGTRDTLFAVQEAASALLPDAAFVRVADGGVFMFDERPNEVAGVIAAFIAREEENMCQPSRTHSNT